MQQSNFYLWPYSSKDAIIKILLAARRKVFLLTSCVLWDRRCVPTPVRHDEMGGQGAVVQATLLLHQPGRLPTDVPSQLQMCCVGEASPSCKVLSQSEWWPFHSCSLSVPLGLSHSNAECISKQKLIIMMLPEVILQNKNGFLFTTQKQFSLMY